MSFVGAVGIINCDLLFTGVPRLPGEGEEVYAREFQVAFGGGVPAIMLSLSRLNVPVRLGTYLGDDLFSDFARRTLDASNVCYENLYRGEGVPVTVTAVAVTERDRTFLSSTAAHCARDDIREQAYRVMRGARVVRMGASSALKPVYERLKAEGATLVLDTGWSDGLCLDTYAPLLELADYYLPNRKEALAITGQSTAADAARVLRRYLDKAVVKLDSEGCCLLDENGARVIPPLADTHTVDSTGAGDAFCAGFIYGLYHGKPFDECARFGNVMGGLCVRQVGCVTRYVGEEELCTLARTLC